MSDLSRLLDDVYGDPGTPSATDPTAPPPDATDQGGWGDGGDDAFADWADDHGARLDGDDLTDAIDAVRAEADGRPTGALFLSDLGALRPEDTGEVPVVAPSGWHRADDDILPTGRVRRRRRRSGGAATAPPEPAFDERDADGSAFDALAALEVPAAAGPPAPAPDEADEADEAPVDGAAPTRRRRLRRRTG